MKTYPIIDDETRHQSGFEVENAYILPRAIAKLLENLDGVTGVRLIGTYTTDTDVRVRFKYLGRSYSVVEPFGDSSRYLVSPDIPAQPNNAISVIEKVFEEYEPQFWRKVIGDILTLRPLSWIKVWGQHENSRK